MQKEKGSIPLIIILLVVTVLVLLTQISMRPSLKVPIKPSGGSYISSSEQEQEQQEEEVKGPDTSPPTLLNPQPEDGLPFQTRKIYLSLQTDEKADCRYSDVSGVYYESMQGKFSTENGFFHQALITTLSTGKSYEYYVRCIDEQGNKNMEDLLISFWVEEPEDITPPKRSNVYPKGDILSAGTKEITIGITTDEPASCRCDKEAGVAYSSMDYRLDPDKYKKHHTAKVRNLEDGQLYGFYVRCKDLEGNKNTGDVLISFEVASSP